MDLSEIDYFCRAAKERAAAGQLSGADLEKYEAADAAIRRNGKDSRAPRLRAALDNTVDSFGGAMQSRLDSHHWDVGFLRLEKEGREILRVAEGYILIAEENDDGESALICIPPEEVRQIGGAPDE